MATPHPFPRSRYLLAAHNHRQLPPDGGFEVAFAGRSNAGKSSALKTRTSAGSFAFQASSLGAKLAQWPHQ